MEEGMKEWWKDLAINLWNVGFEDNPVTQVVDGFTGDENQAPRVYILG